MFFAVSFRYGWQFLFLVLSVVSFIIDKWLIFLFRLFWWSETSFINWSSTWFLCFINLFIIFDLSLYHFFLFSFLLLLLLSYRIYIWTFHFFWAVAISNCASLGFKSLLFFYPTVLLKFIYFFNMITDILYAYCSGMNLREAFFPFDKPFLFFFLLWSLKLRLHFLIKGQCFWCFASDRQFFLNFSFSPCCRGWG